MKSETHYEVEKKRTWRFPSSILVPMRFRQSWLEPPGRRDGGGGILGNLIVLEEEEQIRDFFKTKIQCLNDAVFLCLSVVKNMRD